ncbi:hypothetical protein R75777_06974 [Paraburkholderia nemoris]|nr:hypothetical protein R75777_06974 [Paraburkholderia nemoris]
MKGLIVFFSIVLVLSALAEVIGLVMEVCR